MTRPRHVPAHHDTWRGLWREARQMVIDGTAPPLITVRWAALMVALAGIGGMCYALADQSGMQFSAALAAAVGGLGALTREVITPPWDTKQSSNSEPEPNEPGSPPLWLPVGLRPWTTRSSSPLPTGPRSTREPSMREPSTIKPSAPPWEQPDGGKSNPWTTD